MKFNNDMSSNTSGKDAYKEALKWQLCFATKKILFFAKLIIKWLF